jgi:hypothetical protein
MQYAARANSGKMPSLSAMTAASALIGSNAAHGAPSSLTQPVAPTTAVGARPSAAATPSFNVELGQMHAVRRERSSEHRELLPVAHG